MGKENRRQPNKSWFSHFLGETARHLSLDDPAQRVLAFGVHSYGPTNSYKWKYNSYNEGHMSL